MPWTISCSLGPIWGSVICVFSYLGLGYHKSVGLKGLGRRGLGFKDLGFTFLML